MASQRKKRKLTHRPGLFQAAKDLGCDYSHLRRVVIGQRESRSLKERYNLWQETAVATQSDRVNSKNLIHVPRDASGAGDNLTPAFFDVLNQLGLEVVLVRLQASHGSVIWEFPRFENDLDRELSQAGAGNHDATHYSNFVFWHFFHVRNLALAMLTLRDSLEKRGLLGLATILHGETSATMRVWYPATAETVATSHQ